MSCSNNPIPDEDQLIYILRSKRLTYEVFDGLRGLIVISFRDVNCLTYMKELLDMDKGTFDSLSVRRALLRVWPNMDASAKEEIFNALCGPTQEGATPEEETPGPADVREVTEAMGDIAIGNGPQKPTVTSKGTNAAKSGHCRFKARPDQNYELEAEKAKLAQKICARIKEEYVQSILKLMGGFDEYYKFIEEHDTEVRELMNFLPKKPAVINEEQQRAAFMPLLGRIINVANGIWRPKDPAPKSPRQYYLYDTHRTPPVDTKLMPGALVSTDPHKRLGTAELVVEFMQHDENWDNISTESTLNIYGQLGIYARRVWAKQPMRRFVPVLLVRRLWVTLFLFARSKVHLLELGPAFAGEPDNRVIRLLLFLLSGEKTNLGVVLPPMSGNAWAMLFSSPCQGLFCQRLGIEVDDKAQIQRRRQQQQPQPTSPRPVDHPTASHFEVDEVVSAGRADLFNQAAFLARGTFVDSNGKRTKAVLKFAWWETSQQTECEVYGVLHWKGVPHVPELLLSGYVSEWDSGVLECLVVADAGQSLREYRADDLNARRDPELLKRVATAVTQCLWDASQAGVRHRDISTGNVCVDEDGTVRVIDWGCARVEPKTLQDNRRRLKKAFPGDPSFASLSNVYEIGRKERMHDLFIGTPCFLSIRVLSIQCENRSVVDDIESLLYVLIYFVAKDRSVFENMPGWSGGGGLLSKWQAREKAVAFIEGDYPHTWASLGDLEEPCLGFLLAFARRLFIDKVKGTSIVDRVLDYEKDPRMSYDLAYWLGDDSQQATTPGRRRRPTRRWPSATTSIRDQSRQVAHIYF